MELDRDTLQFNEIGLSVIKPMLILFELGCCLLIPRSDF